MDRIDSQGDFDAIRQAAERGYAEAQLYLGSMYANGLGVPQDDAEAVRWFRLAAERASKQGYANAEVARFRLGTMYKDSVLAYIWFTIAGTNGNETAKDLRDDLERNMARAEISRATELARACRASDYQDCEP